MCARLMSGQTYIWKGLAGFLLEAELLFDEPGDLNQLENPSSGIIWAYSAAVCELSEACEMLLVRAFDAMLVSMESAMVVDVAVTTLLVSCSMR